MKRGHQVKDLFDLAEKKQFVNGPGREVRTATGFHGPVDEKVTQTGLAFAGGR
jgi:hypothetical protein